MDNEWLPQSYILQIRYQKCVGCKAEETSSQLYLVERHMINKSATRRREASHIDARLKRGTSTRTVQVPVCHKCFTPYEPVYTPRDSDLVCVQPGKPVLGNGFAGLKLEDL